MDLEEIRADVRLNKHGQAWYLRTAILYIMWDCVIQMQTGLDLIGMSR